MNQRLADKLLFAFFVAMFIYVLLRALNVYITCDEAWSYNTYVVSPLWNTLAFKPAAANNHILNTLLMKLSALFSVSELALRLPNVLAYILYIYAVKGIAGIYFSRKNIYYYSLILVLCLNPFLSEFFAYARGYGLCIAFMMLGIYHLMLAFAADKYKKNIHVAFLSFVLAVSANLVLLNAIPAIWAISAYVIYYRQGNRNLFAALILPFLYGILLLAVAAYPYYVLKVSNGLYWGGITNFISDTLAGIVEDIFALRRHTFTWAIAVAVFLILLLLQVIILIRGLYRKERDISRLPLYIVPIILLFCTLFINLQFYLFDVRLLKHRTAIFLHPLFALTLFSAIKLLSEKKARPAVLVTYAISIIMIIGFAVNANISHSTEWAYNEYDRQVLKDISSTTEAGSHPTLFVHDYQAHTFQYLIGRYKYSTSVMAGSIENPQIKEDYVYLLDQDISILPPGYALYRSYGNGRYQLYKKTVN